MNARISDAAVEAAKRAMYFSANPDATEGEYIDDSNDPESAEVAHWLRVILTAALPHLTQPAELAGQQGVELPPLPDKNVIDTHLPTGVRIYGYCAEQMREYARAALGATGNQQVGMFPWENLPAYLIDKCEGDTISEEAIQRAVADMARDARYCPPQQVGEDE